MFEAKLGPSSLIEVCCYCARVIRHDFCEYHNTELKHYHWTPQQGKLVICFPNTEATYHATVCARHFADIDHNEAQRVHTEERYLRFDLQGRIVSSNATMPPLANWRALLLDSTYAEAVQATRLFYERKGHRTYMKGGR